MRYKVTKQYAKGSELACAQFDDVADARLFIQSKVDADRMLNVNVVYRLSMAGEVIETHDASGVSDTKPATSSGASSSGKGSGATFRPTLLNTAPRPPGTPQKWFKDDEEDEKKK